MDYILLLEIVYVLVVVTICIRVIIDTDHSGKTIAYLLTIIFLPVVGSIFYLTFGVNYRKRKIYTKKLESDHIQSLQLQAQLQEYNRSNIIANSATLADATGLVNLIASEDHFPLTLHNSVKVLINGEEKFPEVLRQLQAAQHHIHIEYYIYEDDQIGNAIKEILIQKAQQGVKVRLIYDDLGSAGIRRKFVRELRKHGVEAYPFNKIQLLLLANRINYRNHRKIIVVDGQIGFVGGINISDRYDNSNQYSNNDKQSSDLYWRDTHLQLKGPAVLFLQYVFLCDWNFCAKQQLSFNQQLFPRPTNPCGDQLVQMIAAGPDSAQSLIHLSYIKAISIAKEEILITTPYFIPGESFIDALKVAALAGIKVKLLVPGKSDSRLVNAAAWSNYDALLYTGVEIYLYQKGFVHAKSMVIDNKISIVGTANLDFRSFNMNFEINAVVYDPKTSQQLSQQFYEDIREATKLDADEFHNRPLYKKIPERIARLFSPIL